MKRTLALVLLLATLLPNNVTAQNMLGRFSLPVMIQCTPSNIMLDILSTTYGESPIALGDGTVFRPNGLPVLGQMLFWHTPSSTDQTNKFTITISFGKENEVTCIVINGNNLHIFYDPDKDKTKT